MSDLRDWYEQLRAQGLGHFAAIDKLAARIDVDRGTITRTLKKAQERRRAA